MNSINCEDLQFDDMSSAVKFVSENEIKIFSDEGDLILCYMDSSEGIKKNWNDITTKTALDFQSNLVDQVTSRNLLLVFCSNEEIDIDTKKEIQSDTYCCRKIARSNVENLESSIKELIFYGTEKEEEVNKSSLIEIIEKKHPEVFQLMAM
ncbi:hypothetical protein AB6D22_23610 [Vibrio splendidus]